MNGMEINYYVVPNWFMFISHNPERIRVTGTLTSASVCTTWHTHAHFDKRKCRYAQKIGAILARRI